MDDFIVRKPKICPYCNRIVSGRTDKMFCDDRCRNNYYYKINGERKAFIRKINKTLLQNRGILRSLNPSGKTAVLKSALISLGFDFSCYTSTYKTKKGKEYYIVYDQAYCIEDDDNVSLVVFYGDTQAVVG